MKYGIYYAYWEKQWGADYLKYVKKVKDQGFDILEISCAGLKDMPKEEIEKLKAYKDELKDGVMKKKDKIEKVGYKKYMEEK